GVGVSDGAQPGRVDSAPNEFPQHACGPAGRKLPVRWKLPGLDRHGVAVAFDRNGVPLAAIDYTGHARDDAQPVWAEHGLAGWKQQLVADAKADRFFVDDDIHVVAQAIQAQFRYRSE